MAITSGGARGHFSFLHFARKIPQIVASTPSIDFPVSITGPQVVSKIFLAQIQSEQDRYTEEMESYLSRGEEVPTAISDFIAFNDARRIDVMSESSAR